MYVLELAFSHDPDRLQQRLAVRPAHRERMASLKADGKVLVGGPFADESGALLVFLVDTEVEAQALIDADAYFTTPGVEVVSLRAWNAVTRHDAIENL